jgi:hypothetical protein
MKRLLSALAVVSLIGFAVVLTTSHAENMASSTWRSYELGQLVNYTVKNHEGEYLGRTQDFVIDSNGRIVFAIISKPGFLGIRGPAVAVPFEALSFGDGSNSFVLDMSREQFAAAPLFNRVAGLDDSGWAAYVYRYFGVQPYWTD